MKTPISVFPQLKCIGEAAHAAWLAVDHVGDGYQVRCVTAREFGNGAIDSGIVDSVTITIVVSRYEALRCKTLEHCAKFHVGDVDAIGEPSDFPSLLRMS